MSSYNNTLTYQPLSALISQLSLEMPKFANMGMFDDILIMDMVMYCIRDLGIKVYQRKDVVLDIVNNKCEVPFLLHSINFAGLCLDYDICLIPPQGPQVWDVEIDELGQPKDPSLRRILWQQLNEIEPCHINGDCKSNTTTNCCGQPVQEECGNEKPIRYFVQCDNKKFQLFQVFKTHAVRYKEFVPLFLERNHADNLLTCEECLPPNIHKRFNTFRKIGDAFYFNIKTGKVYFNYMSYPYDDATNEMLVPADPIIWNFIMYYIKYRVLQTVIINGNDENIKSIYGDVKQDYLRYYHQAKTLVNMPSFRQIREAWKSNRKIMTETYYRPFLA